jgi:hypothetical protein
MMETGLFDIQVKNLRNNYQTHELPPNLDVIHSTFGRAYLSDRGTNVSTQIRADVAAVSGNWSAERRVRAIFFTVGQSA